VLTVSRVAAPDCEDLRADTLRSQRRRSKAGHRGGAARLRDCRGGLDRPRQCRSGAAVEGGRLPTRLARPLSCQMLQARQSIGSTFLRQTGVLQSSGFVVHFTGGQPNNLSMDTEHCCQSDEGLPMLMA
jgi:hypothetical protein